MAETKTPLLSTAAHEPMPNAKAGEPQVIEVRYQDFRFWWDQFYEHIEILETAFRDATRDLDDDVRQKIETELQERHRIITKIMRKADVEIKTNGNVAYLLPALTSLKSYVVYVQNLLQGETPHQKCYLALPKHMIHEQDFFGRFCVRGAVSLRAFLMRSCEEEAETERFLSCEVPMLLPENKPLPQKLLHALASSDELATKFMKLRALIGHELDDNSKNTTAKAKKLINAFLELSKKHERGTVAFRFDILPNLNIADDLKTFLNKTLIHEAREALWADSIVKFRSF